MFVSLDRWTCPEPGCGTTVTSASRDADVTARMLRRAQVKHGRRHAAERDAATGRDITAAEAGEAS